MDAETFVSIIKPYREGQAEAVQIGDPSQRIEYTREDGTKGTYGNCRKIFRIVNDKLHHSEKFVLGIAVFAPGEGGMVQVHENAEEFSYIISGGGSHLDKDNKVCGHFTTGDVKFVPKGAYHGAFCDSDEPLVMLFGYSAGGELPKK